MLTNLCIWNDFKSAISFAYINITYSNLAKFLKIYIQSINIIIDIDIIVSFLQYFLFIIKSLMYIIYDKTSTENGRVIIIELKGKKCEGILIFRNRLSCIE